MLEYLVAVELCADVIVSAAAAARRSISAAARRGRPKTFFSKIHEKIKIVLGTF